MDYYSVKAILAEEEKVPTTFNTAVSDLGRQLDPSTSDVDLKQGTSIELPLWMVPKLAERNIVSVRMRRCYGERTKRELEAGAARVSLRDHSNYYYNVGVSLCNLIQQPMLGRLLMYSFRERYGSLLLKAFSLKDADVGSMSLLCREEAELFQSARTASREFNKWRRSTTQLIKAPDILKRKRKFTVLGSISNSELNSRRRLHS